MRTLDEERRRVLQEKRIQLQAKLLRFEAEKCLASLRAAGLDPVELDPRSVTAHLQRLGRLPVVDEHVDWSRIEGATLIYWRSENERDTAVCDMIRRYGGKSGLIIYWGSPLPSVVVAPTTLLNAIGPVLDMAPETSIFSVEPGNHWLAENSHFDRLVGSAPEALQGSGQDKRAE